MTTMSTNNDAGAPDGGADHYRYYGISPRLKPSLDVWSGRALDWRLD